jgi:hypothetical protein
MQEQACDHTLKVASRVACVIPFGLPKENNMPQTQPHRNTGCVIDNPHPLIHTCPINPIIISFLYIYILIQ